MGGHGIAEVRLGQLAAERGSSPEVKRFGQRMVADHTKANEELKAIASQARVTLPSQPDEDHQELHSRLSRLSGQEFDREYMKAMVDGHEEVLRELETHASANANRPAGDRAVGTSGDASGRSAADWASKTLPTVRQHRDEAKQINDTLGKRKA
jgi:putative membrane protein